MTEKNYNPQQRNSKTMKKQKVVESKVENVTSKNEESKEEKKIEEVKETKPEIKSEDKKNKIKKEIPKKYEAVINAKSLPLSTKDCKSICKFINHKGIEKAIEDLEEVSKFKKVIPMKKGFPHKKGRGVMAGKYHTKAVIYFIKMLKELKANSNVNQLENPIITEAVANRASMPYGRFGRVRRKRTHIKIKTEEKVKKENK